MELVTSTQIRKNTKTFSSSHMNLYQNFWSNRTKLHLKMIWCLTQFTCKKLRWEIQFKLTWLRWLL